MWVLREVIPQPCVTNGDMESQREEGGCPRSRSKCEVRAVNPDLSVLVPSSFCKLGLQKNLLKS